VADHLFELDSNGYIAFQEKVVPAGAEELAKRGVRACPERALKIAANDARSE